LVQCSRHFLRHTLRRLLESARHGFYHGMMEDVLNDESENISLSQLLKLTSPHNSCIKNETLVREAEGIFKIEVPDNVRKIVIVKVQVHGIMTYIIPPPLFFFCNFVSFTYLLVSNNRKSTISFSLY
jgi:hypothetical protein